MKNIKTLWQLLQNIVEEEWRYYSLFEFLTNSTEEDRKQAEIKLDEANINQFYDFMDSYSFVSEDEVNAAVCEYYEKSMDRPISMGEYWDLSEAAERYINEKWLIFNND